MGNQLSLSLSLSYMILVNLICNSLGSRRITNAAGVQRANILYSEGAGPERKRGAGSQWSVGDCCRLEGYGLASVPYVILALIFNQLYFALVCKTLETSSQLLCPNTLTGNV